MKNLGRHIEALLRDNDCVIVPGLGGFIARAVPAHYAADEELFFPPSRTVVFNERLSANDGLLVGRYMHDYQIGYADAAHKVDMDVDHLRDMLAMDGEAVLPGVGCLRQDAHSLLTFEAEAAGIESPEHFGLSAIHIQQLDMLAKATTSRPSREPLRLPAATQPAATRIGHALTAAAAVALLLILFALPTANEHPAATAGLPGLPQPAFKEIAGLHIEAPVGCPTLCMGDNIGEATIPSAAPTMESVVATASTATASEELATSAVVAETTPAVPETVASPAPKADDAPEATPVPVSGKRYHLIVGSLASRKGADDMVNKYIGRGYTDATILESDGRVRISIASYADKDEANAEIARLRESGTFKGVWLLPVKN